MNSDELKRISLQICRFCDADSTCQLCRLRQMWRTVILMEAGVEEKMALTIAENEAQKGLRNINMKYDRYAGINLLEM